MFLFLYYTIAIRKEKPKGEFMIRKIIKINQDLCNGCGACVAACHEGAIQMVNGKAVLTREDYCDGLGDCLPACPTDAISFEEREAPAYDEAAVKKAQAEKANPLPCGCPGTAAKTFTPSPCSASVRNTSQLRQWPVQIKLLPIQAPYYEQADLLIAATALPMPMRISTRILFRDTSPS